jgi:hypothetical protein
MVFWRHVFIMAQTKNCTQVFCCRNCWELFVSHENNTNSRHDLWKFRKNILWYHQDASKIAQLLWLNSQKRCKLVRIRPYISLSVLREVCSDWLIDGATASEYPWISSASFWDTLLHFGKWLRLEVSRFSAKFRSGMLLKYIKIREINQFSELKIFSAVWCVQKIRSQSKIVEIARKFQDVSTRSVFLEFRTFLCKSRSVVVRQKFDFFKSLMQTPSPSPSSVGWNQFSTWRLLFGEGLLRKKYPLIFSPYILREVCSDWLTAPLQVSIIELAVQVFEICSKTVLFWVVVLSLR